MKLTFVQPAMFVSQWKRLRLSDEDLQALEQLIMRAPDAGVLISGAGGLRKLRFAPPSWNRGKSGAARVCYVCFAKAAACYLMDIYTHKEKDNLSDIERANARDAIRRLRKLLNED